MPSSCGASEAGTTSRIRSPSSTRARSLSTSPAATSTRRPASTTSGWGEGIGGAYSRPPPAGGRLSTFARCADGVARADTSNMVRRKHHASIVAGGHPGGPGVAARRRQRAGQRRRAHVVRPADGATRSPRGSRPGPDGMTWVASRGRRRDRARRARTAPCRRSASSSGVDPYDIVRGPDGAMWFTEHNGNRIGRLTTDGELSEFYLRDLSTPTGITVGPDGALWFAQRGVSAIGRITRRRRDHGMADDHPPCRTAQHHDRLRRRPVVHADGRQRHRPDHGRRHDDRVPPPCRRERSPVDHDRSGRRALVHRSSIQHDRPHDDGRRRSRRTRSPRRRPA